MSKTYLFLTLAAATLATSAIAFRETPNPAPAMAPQYDAAGDLVMPADYREWVFLSSGIDMSYNPHAIASADHVFDNVFAPPAAHAAFKRTGVWPDKTVLILENRAGASNGSINRRGQFQTGEVVGLEAHVKDVARFKGGWGFFAFGDASRASLIPDTATCYSCHQQHAAADTTFVQFYPTLLPVATRLKTLNPLYPAATSAIRPATK